jgi:hypothetical protein
VTGEGFRNTLRGCLGGRPTRPRSCRVIAQLLSILVGQTERLLLLFRSARIDLETRPVHRPLLADVNTHGTCLRPRISTGVAASGRRRARPPGPAARSYPDRVRLAASSQPRRCRRAGRRLCRPCTTAVPPSSGEVVVPGTVASGSPSTRRLLEPGGQLEGHSCRLPVEEGDPV